MCFIIGMKMEIFIFMYMLMFYGTHCQPTSVLSKCATNTADVCTEAKIKAFVDTSYEQLESKIVEYNKGDAIALNAIKYTISQLQSKLEVKDVSLTNLMNDIENLKMNGKNTSIISEDASKSILCRKGQGNLALNVVTMDGSNSADSWKVVDGQNSLGSDALCYNSKTQDQPWLLVDLGAQYLIDTVELTLLSAQRNLLVLVSQVNPLVSNGLPWTFSTSQVNFCSFNASEGIQTIKCQETLCGRYVILKKYLQNAQLEICEVGAFSPSGASAVTMQMDKSKSCKTGSGNLALRKIAKQHPLQLSRRDVVPEKAVDGTPSGTEIVFFGAGNIKHAWLFVDLGEEFLIRRVYIRTSIRLAGTEGDTLIGITKDDPENELSTTSPGNVCGTAGYGRNTIVCITPVCGRYVYVQTLNNVRGVWLSELEVYST